MPSIHIDLAAARRRVAPLWNEWVTQPHQERARMRAGTGQDYRDLSDYQTSTDPLVRQARDQHRPALIAGIAAATVFAATGVFSAPVALFWHPWGLIQPLLGRSAAAWNASETGRFLATTPLLSAVIWLAAYSALLHGVRNMVVAARCGRMRYLDRAVVGALALVLAAVTYWVQSHVAPGWPVSPLLLAGVVLGAWRVLANTTARQARLVHQLNVRLAEQHYRGRAQQTQQISVVSLPDAEPVQ
jgi:hypothetical protein